MVREAKAKAASLMLAAGVILLYFLGLDAEKYGLCVGATLFQRLSFHFFHASFLHAALNAWVLLSVAFLFDISIYPIITAFVIASAFPINFLHDLMPCAETLLLPTIGLSGVCYALMGRIAFMVAKKWEYQGWMAFYIGVGFLFPNMNGWIHLYCYLVGLVVGFLNKPLR